MAYCTDFQWIQQQQLYAEHCMSNIVYFLTKKLLTFQQSLLLNINLHLNYGFQKCKTSDIAMGEVWLSDGIKWVS